MGKLLAGHAPLRGRAGLELIVPTLDFRLAREFWGIAGLRTAMLTHAIVGGTPAYRREFAQDDTPADAGDFDPWVCRTVLNPGRPDLAHPLGVLHDAGLITHETDAFRKNRSAYRIAEPLLIFYHAIMRPAWGDLERPGRAAQVWRRSQHTFTSNVAGPHFEEICRRWARWYAGLPDGITEHGDPSGQLRRAHHEPVVPDQASRRIRASGRLLLCARSGGVRVIFLRLNAGHGTPGDGRVQLRSVH